MECSYLLAPQSPVVPTLGSSSGRIVLLGSRNPLLVPNFHTEHDPIIFSEIAEFAMSLCPTTKGQEQFHGCVHLQAYKLIRAVQLAELGHIQAANRSVLQHNGLRLAYTFIDIAMRSHRH